jgi:DNA gyrase inhibitor GyrI
LNIEIYELIIMANWDIQVEYQESLIAVYAHVLSENPEKDVSDIIWAWASENGLPSKNKDTRMFGRNTYPTDQPEPHGYQLFATVKCPIDETEEIKNGEIPGGYYAILRSTTISQMSGSWPELWKWLEESDYTHTGWIKGKYGWESGLEENISLYEANPPEEGKFNLLIPVKKKTT